jgi:uncharacterized ferritin-like protein (DUF455 family)
MSVYIRIYQHTLTYIHTHIHTFRSDSQKTTDNILGRLAIINLTHEAKGLDSYPKTRRKFESEKEIESLCILDNNYKEEIGHVALGVKWFKYICQNSRENNGQSRRKLLLDNYTQEEEEHTVRVFHSLSRQHFKGKLKPPFNVDARIQAGLLEKWFIPLSCCCSARICTNELCSALPKILS